MWHGMSLIHNERTKLTATALNTVATSCMTVGVLAPMAAAWYNFGAFPVRLPWMASGVLIWLAIALLVHYDARRTLGRLRP